jgi:tRNA(adenine34) deaminase
MEQEYYMNEALKLAEKAYENGETPVGCVIVSQSGEIIGKGFNRTEEEDATCHAEIEAIRDASKNINSWRLDGCSLFVTMEPCPMCAGAILNSRISRIYYGVKDPRAGSCGSVINLFMENYGHSPQIYGGILETQCKDILSRFFKAVRDR